MGHLTLSDNVALAAALTTVFCLIGSSVMSSLFHHIFEHSVSPIEKERSLPFLIMMPILLMGAAMIETFATLYFQMRIAPGPAVTANNFHWLAGVLAFMALTELGGTIALGFALNHVRVIPRIAR